MKIQRKFLAICIAIIMVFAFVACGTTPNNEGDTVDRPSNISIIAGSSGAAWYIVGGGMASVIDQHVEGVSATVEPGGGAENIIRVENKECTLGMTMSDNLYYAKLGEREYDEVYDNVRVIISGHDNPMKLMARADSGITTVEQLRGKKVGMGYPGSSQALASNAMMISMGLVPDVDFTAVWLTPAEIAEGLQDKTLDAGFNYTADPSGAMTELTSNVDIVFITMDVDKIVAEHPYWYKTTLPAGTYKGLDEDYVTVGANVLLVAHKDTDADLIYDITKALLENQDEIAAVHQVGKEWCAENITRGVTVEYHEGALRYFEEANIDVSGAAI